MATPFRAWDDYFIPGTDVLRNKLGATTAEDLRVKEELASSLRIDQLAADPVQGTFDFAHMKEIHRRIFQDVYEWPAKSALMRPRSACRRTARTS